MLISACVDKNPSPVDCELNISDSAVSSVHSRLPGEMLGQHV